VYGNVNYFVQQHYVMVNINDMAKVNWLWTWV